MTRSHRSSPERRLLLAALLLAGLALPGAVPAGAVTPDEVRQKAQAALADPKYQRSLPDHEEKAGTAKTPHRRQRGNLGDGAGEGPDVSIPVIGAGAFVSKVVFVVLFVVVGLLIAGWILREIVDRRRKRGVEVAPGGAPAAASASALSLSFDDASRLAAEGRYAEAVHALLLAAIRHFAERSKTAIPPSRTSRELVRLLPLGPDARDAFAELVRTVELSLFGGADLGAEDYERNLARFQALTRRAA
ncbi:MAG: DUF4129 domain-containing protein [Thermoanaerobaculia bacterium]